MSKALAVFIATLLLPMAHGWSNADKKWTSEIPKQFEDSDQWVDLVKELKLKKMHYGAVAGARRMIDHFGDMKSKEFAYQTIVELIDFGYPFSLRSVFMAGDLELKGQQNFSQSYNLYKGSLDLEKNLPKWAETYFSKVDTENFPKYLFYEALNKYNSGQLDESLTLLDKALAGLQDPTQLSLSKKAARTMARIHYEKGDYAESLDIYQNYLLKLNPVDPDDWIEASWALYKLGRFEEALGYVFNMESPESKKDVNLEKYIIRALIYRDRCVEKSIDNLIASFETDFGPTIRRIKTGEALRRLPALIRVLDKSSNYYRVRHTLENLKAEGSQIKELPKQLGQIAGFLYSTEMRSQASRLSGFEKNALSDSARRVIKMSESLKFLKFEVAREKYNPDKVFMATANEQSSFIEPVTRETFLLHWIQWGDFWRDERLLYRGKVGSRCE